MNNYFCITLSIIFKLSNEWGLVWINFQQDLKVWTLNKTTKHLRSLVVRVYRRLMKIIIHKMGYKINQVLKIQVKVPSMEGHLENQQVFRIKRETCLTISL